MSSAATNTPPRRRAQFSLRGLLMLMTVVAMALGATTNHFRRVRARAALQIALVEQWKLRGVLVQYESEQEPSWWIRLVRQRIHPEAYRGLLGLHFSSDKPMTAEEAYLSRALFGLRELSLDGTDVTDEMLSHVAGIPGLTDLRCVDCQNVSPQGIAHLGAAADLRSVLLMGSQVSEDHVAALAGLPTLTQADFTDVWLSAKSLRHLAAAPRLQGLSLYRGGWDQNTPGMNELTQLKRLGFLGSEVRPPGLAQIGRLVGLEELDIAVPGGLSPADWQSLGRLEKLRVLLIKNAPVGREGLAVLLRLQSLERLQLTDAGITDDDLPDLVELPRLDCLEVGPRISTPAAEALHKLRPTLTLVYWDGMRRELGPIMGGARWNVAAP